MVATPTPFVSECGTLAVPRGPRSPKWESQVPGGGGVTDGSEWVCIQGKVNGKITPRPLEFSLPQGPHAGWQNEAEKRWW